MDHENIKILVFCMKFFAKSIDENRNRLAFLV